MLSTLRTKIVKGSTIKITIGIGLIGVISYLGYQKYKQNKLKIEKGKREKLLLDMKEKKKLLELKQQQIQDLLRLAAEQEKLRLEAEKIKLKEQIEKSIDFDVYSDELIIGFKQDYIKNIYIIVKEFMSIHKGFKIKFESARNEEEKQLIEQHYNSLNLKNIFISKVSMVNDVIASELKLDSKILTMAFLFRSEKNEKIKELKELENHLLTLECINGTIPLFEEIDFVGVTQILEIKQISKNDSMFFILDKIEAYFDENYPENNEDDPALQTENKKKFKAKLKPYIKQIIQEQLRREENKSLSRLTNEKIPSGDITHPQHLFDASYDHHLKENTQGCRLFLEQLNYIQERVVTTLSKFDVSRDV